MEHVVPVANWTHFLAQYVKDAQSGDTIVVTSRSMKELGERARQRLCPEKPLKFKIKKQEPAFYGD